MMTIGTANNCCVVALATNATDNSFPSRIPTTTEPTGDGVLSVPNPGQVSPTNAMIVPFGVGSDNHTFDLRVIGWRKVTGSGLTSLWVPVVLGQFACTLSTAVGVANTPVSASNRFADTISRTLGIENVADQVVSPAGASLDNLVGHILMDVKGFSKIELNFDVGTAASGNALVAWM